MIELPDWLQGLFAGPGPGIIWIGLGSGVLLLFVGLVSLTRERDPVSRRLLDGNAAPASAAAGPDALVRPKSRRPSGLMKGIVPADEKQYSNIRRQLQQCGFHGPNAVTVYFVLRSVVGLLLPGLLGLFIFVRPMLELPELVEEMLPELSRQETLYVIAGLVAAGFYGPSYYVKKRIEERRLRITEGFPNALDLMQVSIEAGLGFDSTMQRVASEISRSCPEIAREFNIAQSEISAGRERDAALTDMADRMGVPEVRSFVVVILQSMQFGTSVSDALTTYAREMRIQRELKAQEKANKLPVQMSGILVMFMLPALLLLVLAPIIIRYLRILGPAMSGGQ